MSGSIAPTTIARIARASAGATSLLSELVYAQPALIRRANFALGLGLPLVAFGGARFSRGKSLLLLALPVVIFGRATKIISDRDVDQRDAAIYAAFLVLGKVPNALGQLRCFALTLTGREKRIIEYK